MNKINKWEEEYVPRITRFENGHGYTNVMECIKEILLVILWKKRY